MATNNEKMTTVLGDLMRIDDPECLRTIQHAAFERAREMDRVKAESATSGWRLGDDVQMSADRRNTKPFGAVGKIKKINQVRIRVDFGNGWVYNVPKSMLVKAE